MGFYINEDSTGKPLPSKGKYEALIADGGAPTDGKNWKDNLICVVENGPYDAAGFAYSEAQMQYMAEPDGRPKRWLTHPLAKKLAAYDE